MIPLRFYILAGTHAAAFIAGGWTVWQAWDVAELEARAIAAESRAAIVEQQAAAADRIAMAAQTRAAEARARAEAAQERADELEAEFRANSDRACDFDDDARERLRDGIPIHRDRANPAAR